jgi:hypothetical protein
VFVEEPRQKTLAVYLVEATSGADFSSIEKIGIAIG